MLVSYRGQNSDAAWQVGIMRDPSVVINDVGDILATETPSGVGFKRTPPLFLQNDNVVEVEIEHIGRLRNLVKREDK